MVLASGQNLPWTPPMGGVSSMSIRRNGEPWPSQDALEGLHLTAGNTSGYGLEGLEREV